MTQAVHATHLYTVIKGLTPKVKLSLHTWITAAPALHADPRSPLLTYNENIITQPTLE